MLSHWVWRAHQLAAAKARPARAQFRRCNGQVGGDAKHRLGDYGHESNILRHVFFYSLVLAALPRILVLLQV